MRKAAIRISTLCLPLFLLVTIAGCERLTVNDFFDKVPSGSNQFSDFQGPYEIKDQKGERYWVYRGWLDMEEIYFKADSITTPIERIIYRVNYSVVQGLFVGNRITETIIVFSHNPSSLIPMYSDIRTEIQLMSHTNTSAYKQIGDVLVTVSRKKDGYIDFLISH